MDSSEMGCSLVLVFSSFFLHEKVKQVMAIMRRVLLRMEFFIGVIFFDHEFTNFTFKNGLYCITQIQKMCVTYFDSNLTFFIGFACVRDSSGNPTARRRRCEELQRIARPGVFTEGHALIIIFQKVKSF